MGYNAGEMVDVEGLVQRQIEGDRFNILCNVNCDNGPVPPPVKQAFARLLG